MKTKEKMDLIASLLEEVAKDFDEKAELIKELDLPLYRMLTEDGSYYLKEIHKNLYSSGKLNTFKIRLEAANKLLNDKMMDSNFLLPDGWKIYKCTDCQKINVKKDNQKITVGLCDNCEHPLWNDDVYR